MRAHYITNIKHRTLNSTQQKMSDDTQIVPPPADDLKQVAAPTRAPGDLTPWKQHKTRVHRRPTISRVARSGKQSRRSGTLWSTPRVFRTPADELPQLVRSAIRWTNVQLIAEVERLLALPPASTWQVRQRKKNVADVSRLTSTCKLTSRQTSLDCLLLTDLSTHLPVTTRLLFKEDRWPSRLSGLQATAIQVRRRAVRTSGHVAHVQSPWRRRVSRCLRCVRARQGRTNVTPPAPDDAEMRSVDASFNYRPCPELSVIPDTKQSKQYPHTHTYVYTVHHHRRSEVDLKCIPKWMINTTLWALIQPPPDRF